MTDIPPPGVGPLPRPGLSFLTHRLPHAARFNDTYYSRDGGLAEKRHVFLGGCGLPAAWRDAPVFVIGELGFGTGLNFLAAWESWRRTKTFGARLHYIAVEGFPLQPDELSACVDAWTELRHVAPGLKRAYPLPQPGFHRVMLDQGQVALTFLFGAAADMLRAA
ncbi:MAG: bifunctional tRNA (5-methylaminomethyl-2-thiouridine)(34)-methyltransferase MnmD/FAD-dependent 5-carboxymethylaminomethyl-2-thiouridine(34) oxidoreductase MnmC, partial [Rhodospirillaceae bacterium]|nr:bifunctional tRNA (5-methylaminomethyl-2-thiouridine)(34)-methyltransferase MnmD/FAD-dependent 5-carboxymethylaminomethyl-2-thiouridine(34) oxidoreductase MnmC [Rhodospirillaceae bacterium]